MTAPAELDGAGLVILAVLRKLQQLLDLGQVNPSRWAASDMAIISLLAHAEDCMSVAPR